MEATDSLGFLAFFPTLGKVNSENTPTLVYFEGTYEKTRGSTNPALVLIRTKQKITLPFFQTELEKLVQT